MKRLFSWLIACALLLSLLPAGAAAAEEPLTVTPKVDAGDYFSVALDEHGTVWTWGGNGAGQLGDGTTTSRYEAVPVLEGVVDIDAGGDSVMALKADGTLWAWGNNGVGELGVGYKGGNVLTPEQVYLPNQSGVKDFVTGHQYSVVIMGDGTVWAWGYISCGNTIPYNDPCQVEGLDGTGVHTVTCSDQRGFCLFLAGSGTEEDPGRVYGWGDDVYDWYLTDEYFNSRYPREIVFPESQYLTDIRVSEGTIFAVVAGPEPGIYAWGRNDYGQVGNGEKSINDPVTVPYKITGYSGSAPRYVTPGWGSSPIALHEDGTLWTWGYDTLLVPPFTGTNIPILEEPVQIAMDHTAEAAQGTSHAVALRKDGLVYVRGNNNDGQRGVPEYFGEWKECEFDLNSPVQKQDGTPLALETYDGPVHFLTVEADARQGVVLGSPSDAYEAGDAITLTAQAKEGWLFAGWAAEGVALTDVKSPTLSFSMPEGDVTVRAQFEKDLPGMGSGGSFQGTVGAPDADAILISTPEQLASIGVDSAYPLNGSYVLAADLDLSGYASWTPIGTYAAPFTGTFDGQGHVISHLTIDDLLAYGGLFGRVSATGVIKNLGLEQVSIRISGGVDGSCYVGGIAGQMGGNVGSTAQLRNCYVSGSITAQLSSGNLYLGGLAGELDADVSDCFNMASLSGGAGSSTLQSNRLYMGGVAGMIDTYLTDPYVVERCFNEGSLTPSATQSAAYVGGVVGYLSTRVVFRQCYNTAAVWMSPRSYCGRSAYLGGIAGFSDSSLSDCYNLGDVGVSSCSEAHYEMACGGIVGMYALGESGQEYQIANCYNAGKVIARTYGTGYAGGIVGRVMENYARLYVRNCLVLSPSIGVYYDYVFGTGSSGPFKANVLGTDARTESSHPNYYLEGVKSEGYTTISYPSYTNRTYESNVKDQEWYENRLAWDFDGTWAMAENQNGGLPYFAWLTESYQLLSYTNGAARVYCRMAGEKLLVCAASYDESGRLLSTAAVQADLENGVTSVPLPLEQEGAEIRVFLLRSTNLRPVALPLVQ